MHFSQGFCSDFSCASAFSLQTNGTRNRCALFGCATMPRKGEKTITVLFANENSLKFKRKIKRVITIIHMKEVEVTNRKS